MIPEVKERRESTAAGIPFRYSESIVLLLPDPGLNINESSAINSSTSDIFI